MNLNAIAINDFINFIDVLGLEIIIDPDSSIDFRARVEKCIKVLKTTRIGKVLIDAAENDQRKIFIAAETYNPADEQVPGTGTRREGRRPTGKEIGVEIVLDPTDPTFVSEMHSSRKLGEFFEYDRNDVERMNQICACVLGHELGHVFYQKDPENVRDVEEPLRDAFQFPRRPTYHGDAIPLGPPTPIEIILKARRQLN